MAVHFNPSLDVTYPADASDALSQLTLFTLAVQLIDLPVIEGSPTPTGTLSGRGCCCGRRVCVDG